MLVFVVENVAWALVSRGDFVRAEEILADAIKRVPTHHGLIELHEATALLRRPTSASLVAITDQFAKQAKIDVPQSLAA
jgi:hypothetical protein